MICVRLKCTRVANRQGLCHSHYGRAPQRGYVDSAPTKRRLELLLSRGIGWARLEDAGITPQWWRQVGDRVQVRTEARVLAIPVPGRVIAGGEIAAVGTVRRLQALAAMGWPFDVLSPLAGHGPRYLSQLMKRDVLFSSTARKVDELYQTLAMTLGPSNRIRVRSLNRGWVTALAWDDIDDPDETPNVGLRQFATQFERVTELQALGVRDVNRIAERLGTKPKSVERLLARHQKGEAA